MIALETYIAASREDCFAMSLSVDAHTSSMGRSRERAVSGMTRGELGTGDSVTWRATHFGIPWRMTSVITEYARPHRFVDQQSSGPFARWWHEHRFDVCDGGTLMHDVIDFAAPLGVLGRVADRWVLKRHVTGLITDRNAWLKRELERPDRPRNRGAAS